jgi:hypothetical protein
VIAGSGFREIPRHVKRPPILALIFVILLATPLHDFYFVRWNGFNEGHGYVAREANWDSFVSIISGRRLLSTISDVTIHSATPELPDPYLNALLELRGQWDSRPVVVQINDDLYDLVVIESGRAGTARFDYRGIRVWDDAMWIALRENYRLACVLDDMEVWLPNRGSAEIFPSLLGIGCRAAP